MKSKKLTLTLAIFAGSSGADKFYLGQNTAGWSTLLAFWVLLPGFVYAVVKFNLVANWEPFFLGRFAIPIMFHLFAAGRYMVMSDEKFKSQDVSKSKTFPLTIASIALAIALIIVGNRFLNSAKTVDITKADVSVTLSAEQMSKEYRNDEVAYRKNYDNKILQVEGTVSISPGEDLETQTKYLELMGNGNDVFGIKCFFKKENSSNVDQIRAGDKIIVNGECSGNILNNCIVIKIIHPDPIKSTDKITDTNTLK